MENTNSKTYIIFGGSGGIGSEITKLIVERGDQVVIAGRNKDTLTLVCAETGARGLVCDGTDLAQVEEVFKNVKEKEGAIHGVANCIGSVLLKPAHLTSLDEWQDTIRTNLDSAFYILKSGAKAMMKTGGSILLMSSAAARIGLVNHEAIAAAKGGIIGLTQSAAATYANKNIRVNCIAPGLVDSPLTSKITGSESSRKASESMHALGRLGSTKDVAQAAWWLLDSDQSPWVTGQVIGIDGGLGTLRSRG